MTLSLWPKGKKVAFSVAVMFETWSENSAPNYSVQTSHLKQGTFDYASKAWSTFGGRVGVWRTLSVLDKQQIRATFFTSAKCTEDYPDAVKQIALSGHDLGAHGYTQDGLLAYMDVDQQRATIRKSIDLLEGCSGKKVRGWTSPVVAFTPDTAGLLAQEGLSWTGDVTYADLPFSIDTPHGQIIGVPTSDFSDNRVLRGSPADYVHVYKSALDYLVESETMSMLVLVLHCQFGGRPLIAAAFKEILQYAKSKDDVWLATIDEIASWTQTTGSANFPGPKQKFGY